MQSCSKIIWEMRQRTFWLRSNRVVILQEYIGLGKYYLPVKYETIYNNMGH